MSIQLSTITFDYSIPKELTPHSNRIEQFTARVSYEQLTGTGVYNIISITLDPIALIHLSDSVELVEQIRNCVKSKCVDDVENQESN